MSVAEPLLDLTTLDDAQLRALIRARVGMVASGEMVDDWRYGAVSAAQRVLLRRHFAAQPKPAAVLVPLVERPAGLTVLLTQRATHLKNHAGQISFPGGRIEPGDEGPVGAALRESEEEIGLDRRHVEVVGHLPDHLIVSGFRVTPVVGFVAPAFELRLDRTEVDEAFEVPLAFLLDERNHVRRKRHFEGHEVELTDMPWGERNIWGATAGMLYTLYRLLLGIDR